MNESNISFKWDTALSGMIRFFTEGYYIWSKENFYKAMHGEEFAKTDFINLKLRKLEEKGAIIFSGLDDEYIKIVDYEKLIDFEKEAENNK